MTWMDRRLVAGGLVVALGGFVSSCSSVVENDFDEVLSFDGFFTDADCGTGVTAVVLDLDRSPDGAGSGEGLCFAGEACVIALSLTNQTTGIPIPTNGAGGSIAQPVPSNDGVRIQTKRVRIEYLLPFGELPGKEFALNQNIDPEGDYCAEFLFLLPDDSIAMLQNPRAFPEPPYNLTARVTVEGVTEGGLDIRAQSDINVFVTQLDQATEQ